MVRPADWELSITPYLWLADLSGVVGVFPALQPVDVDASFGDIFDNLDFTAMAILQARKGRFVSMLDLAYVDLGISKGIGIRDPEFADADLDTSTLTATAAAGYRLVDQDQTFFDLMAGLRISNVDTGLTLTGPERSVSADRSETWMDPIAAARFHAPLGEKWAFVVYGDIGGFGASSDLTWQLQGVIQYRLGDSWSLSAGWREYEVDFKEDGFVYDVSMGGPILGVSYRF